MPIKTYPFTLLPGSISPRRAAANFIWIIAVIALLHVIGWGVLIGLVVPAELSAGATVFGLGVGATAYMLGVRHAFDADHIAAIDNTTRKLLQQGVRPVSVGFWFSCGHSTVVFVLTLLLALGIKAIATPLLQDDSQLHFVTSVIGTVISSAFLYAIAAINLVVLVNIWTLFRATKSGDFNEAAITRELESRGFLNRLINRTSTVVTKPWQMFVVGLLFGLGFDTATEVGLLVIAGSGAASGLPWYAVLCLPVLFAAGMSLLDTLQGSFMTAAYGWALARPVRKIYYNLVITGLSVAVALIIGTIEIVGLLSERLKLRGPLWNWFAGLDLNMLGFGVAGLFVVIWLGAVAISKFGGARERWISSADPVSVGGGQAHSCHPDDGDAFLDASLSICLAKPRRAKV